MKTIIIPTLIMSLLLAAGASIAKDKPLKVKLTAAKGDCLAGSDTSSLKKAKTGTALTAGTHLKTGKRSYMEVAFLNESCFRIKSRTEAVLDKLGEAVEKGGGRVVRVVKLELIGGETGVKLSNLPRNYLVEVATPAAVAGAGATGFSVNFDKINKESFVKVFDNVVKVASRDKNDKFVEAKPMQQVEVFPWKEGHIKSTGHGVLSGTILGKEFIDKHREKPEEVKIVTTGRAESVTGIEDVHKRRAKTFEAATGDARSSMAGIIIPMHIDDRISVADLLKDSPELSKKVYEIISESKVVDSKYLPDFSAEVTVQINLASLSKAIGKDLTAVLATVRELPKAEYLKKFGTKAYLTTWRAAEVDGHRRLAEKIYGSVIDSKTTLRDVADTDNKIIITIRGIVKDTEIAAERYFADGSIAIDMVVPGAGVAHHYSNIVGENYLSSPEAVYVTDFDQFRALSE